MEKSEDVTSEQVRNHIPDDLALSILSKLSRKSLKRFGCIHKSWAFLFENPNFMSIFRNNFISNHRCYYNDTSLLLHQIAHFPHKYCILHSLSGERFENRTKLDWPNPFQDDDPFFHILDSGSINGILCLYRHNASVVLWNPVTEEFKVIPPSPVESVPPYRCPLVFLHGFGYDHVRDDYKLIRNVCFFPITDYDLDRLGVARVDVPWEDISYDSLWEIYSLTGNSWRKLDVDVPGCRGVAGERLYMDGMCHWWGISPDDEACLVSFDMGIEMFVTTPIPLDLPLDIDESFNFDLVLRRLVVLNGSIALISWYFGTTTFHISILGELGVKESWTKLFIVGPLPCVEHPIRAGKRGVIFFRKKNGELVWFDLSTHMMEELGVKGDHSCHVVIYKESLLPIGGTNH